MTLDVEDKRAALPVQRVVTAFSSETERLIEELPLVNFDLKKFKAWFQPDPDGEDKLMVGCYEIHPKDVEFICGFLVERPKFDFDKLSYFVEAYVSNEDWAKYHSNAGR